MYFFTKKGMIKKTSLKEYDGNYSLVKHINLNMKMMKIIAVCIADDVLSDIIIVTKSGMAIRFLSESVNHYGKNSIRCYWNKFKRR